MKRFIFLLLSLICWIIGLLFLIVLLSIVFAQKVGIGFIIFIIFLISFFVAFGIVFWKASSKKKQSNIKTISSLNPEALVKQTTRALTNEDTFDSPSFDTDTESHYINSAPLSYLEAEILKFWNDKRTDYIVPSYYSENEFGRNVEPVLKKLLSEGFIERSGLEKNISLHTIPDLKVILSDHGLKTSGRKQELIYRLLENLSTVELEELFPVGVYQITKKGIKALSYYSLIFLNSDYAMGFSFYRLKQAKEDNPQMSDKEILIKLALEDMDKAAKRSLYDEYSNIAIKIANLYFYTSDYKIALDFYIAAFFSWNMHTQKFNPSYSYTNPYITDQIDKCGALCDMSLNDLCHRIYDIIVNFNLLGLGTIDNAQKAVQKFKNYISM